MRTKNNKELAKLILAKSKQLCQSIKSKPSKRGRPPIYPDHMLIFALLLKVLENLFPNTPDQTTLWYRFRKIENSHLKKLIHTTAKEIMKKLKAKEFHCLIAALSKKSDLLENNNL